MKKEAPVVAAIIAAVAFILNPEHSNHPSASQPALKIALVGKGMRDCGSAGAPQTSPACAIYRGAKAALHSETFRKAAESGHLTPVLNCSEDGEDTQSEKTQSENAESGNKKRGNATSIELTCYDDQGEADVARQEAQAIVADPYTVAVIGHSLSQTTQAAIRSYAQAGIPVILPVATGDLIGSRGNSRLLKVFESFDSHYQQHRFENSFRIIPSDAEGQVPAMIYALSRYALPKVPREDLQNYVYVVADTAGNNSAQAVPLADALVSTLTAGKFTTCAQDRKNEYCKILYDEHLPQKLASAKAIVYAGTEVGAPTFLKNLAKLGKVERFIIFSDGVKTVDFSGQTTKAGHPGFSVPEYFHLMLTFPAPYFAIPKISDLNNLRRDEVTFVREALTEANQSYEMYGFDSMLVIAEAIDRLTSQGGDLGRHELLTTLQQVRNFQGVHFPYALRNGENDFVSYSLYAYPPFSADHIPETEPVPSCKQVQVFANRKTNANPANFAYGCTIDAQSLVTSSF